MKKINAINLVLSEYFEHNKNVQKVPVAFMMSYFVLAGIFKNDDSKGVNLKSFLKRLEDKNELHLIPFAIVEQKNIAKKWFFERAKYKPIVQEPKKSIKKIKKVSFKKSDVFYVLGLCNKVLLSNFIASKEAFFLKNRLVSEDDLSIHVDGYYPNFNLAIKFIDASQKNLLKQTPSMCTEKALFEEKEYRLVLISFKKLKHHSNGQLKRILREDLEILRSMLAPFYPKTTLF